jgi:hypothetical protein
MTALREARRLAVSSELVRPASDAEIMIATSLTVQVCANTVDDASAGGHFARFGPTTPKRS